MSVIIGGGSGFVGRHLQKCLRRKGYNVKIISRNPQKDAVTWKDLEKHGLPDGTTAVVNLSGENLMNPGRRWGESFKSSLVNSRVETNKQLVKAITHAKQPPKVWVSTSAVGYYPRSRTKEYTEDSEGGSGCFFSELCTKCENSAKLPSGFAGVRHVIVRVGIVLGRDGGTIKQIYVPFFVGLGGRISSGKQWFPWIHVDDVAGIYAHAIEHNSVTGVLNAVAPQLATNAEFTSAFARAMWRPAMFPVPSSALKLMYGSERASVITDGQKVIPKRTLESGYRFIHPSLTSACRQVAKLFSE